MKICSLLNPLDSTIANRPHSDDGPALRLDRAIRDRKEKRSLLRTAEELADQAEERADDAEKAVSMHQASRAIARRDTTSIKAQCKDLQTRLQAARLATRSDAAPASQPDAWGIKEGRSWSGAASESASNDVEERHAEERHVIDERSGIKPGTDDPKRDRLRNDPQRDRWRFDTMPNRTALNVGVGPYHEFAALCRIGWASALSLYSVGRADDSIIDHLRFAGEHMEMANRTTFDPLRAWPDWQSRKSRLHDQANRLDRSNGSSRRSLSNELKMSWTGHANELAKQLIASRLEHLPTCDSHYARLGYQLCYGQQALQIAEVAERDGNRPLMQRSLGDARDRLQGARRELSELPRVKLATGSCADLSPVERMISPISPNRPLQVNVVAANSGLDETLRILAGVRQAAGECSGDLVGTWIGSSGGGGFIIRFEHSGDQYLGRFIMVRPDMQKKDYRQGQVYMKLRKEGERGYVGTWDSSVWGRRKLEQIKVVVSGDHMREETSGGFKTTMSRVPDQLVNQIRLVGNPGMENYYLRGYSEHDINFKPNECGRHESPSSSQGSSSDVVVAAETSPDPRRVGQRYTFTLVLDNRGPNAIHVSSVGATTTINGRQAGSGKNYFSPQNHSGRGWLTSVAPPGRKTMIYRGTGTANADGLGLWKTELTFHTDQGDFTTHTSSRVIR
ncbi:MAG: hypothetical protein KKE21_02550 [Gammaproteobacteria bacterium]|nr:hypothetical protein [Gammaproteobacteria bacterium]MBU1891774.1 hypothetical protein [Gammaproteobacteria bacterium]